MSGLTEAEILTRHQQSLKEARDACQWLSKNADPLYFAPRGRHYRNLKKAMKELEGSARQMAHFRADARWLRLGILYAKSVSTVDKLFAGHNWLGFGQLMALFENGLVRMDALANNKTGTIGMILPKRPSDWIVMPEWRPATRQLWTPQGRLPN